MTTKALATLVSNLIISWQLDPAAPAMIRFHGEMMQAFDGADVVLLGKAIDKARAGPVVGVAEIKAMVRGAQVQRPHRISDDPPKPVRISRINGAFSALQWASGLSFKIIQLGRTIIEGARRDGRLIEDEPPHELITMPSDQIRAWLGERYPMPPDFGDAGTFKRFG